MPEHESSAEERWLFQNYSRLDDFEGQDLRGRWVAVIATSVVDSDLDPIVLVERVETRYGGGRALFTRVLPEPVG